MDQGETVHPMNEQETRRTSKYCNLAANSNKYNFSTFTTSKVARTTAHQRLIFNVKKKVEARIQIFLKFYIDNQLSSRKKDKKT